MALLFVTAVVLLYGVIYPNLSVAINSFQRNGTWTLANYTEILSQRIVLEAIVSSLGLSVATVLCCALVGVRVAKVAILHLRFERTTSIQRTVSRRPSRRIAQAVNGVPPGRRPPNYPSSPRCVRGDAVPPAPDPDAGSVA